MSLRGRCKIGSKAANFETLKKAALTPQKSVHMKIFLGEMGKNEGGGGILKTVGCVFYRHGWDQNIPLAKKD